MRWKVITFRIDNLLHFALMLLHCALVLHFAVIVITFCVSITYCGDYYILRRNSHKRPKMRQISVVVIARPRLGKMYKL